MNILNLLTYTDCVEIEFHSNQERQEIIDKISSQFKFVKVENDTIFYDRVKIRLLKDRVFIKESLLDLEDIVDYYISNKISGGFDRNVYELYKVFLEKLNLEPLKGISSYTENEYVCVHYDPYEQDLSVEFKGTEYLNNSNLLKDIL